MSKNKALTEDPRQQLLFSGIYSLSDAENLSIVISGRDAIGKAKLTQIEVDEIRSKYQYWIYTINKLAKEYNVANTTISHILKRDSWK